MTCLGFGDSDDCGGLVSAHRADRVTVEKVREVGEVTKRARRFRLRFQMYKSGVLTESWKSRDLGVHGSDSG